MFPIMNNQMTIRPGKHAPLSAFFDLVSIASLLAAILRSFPNPTKRPFYHEFSRFSHFPILAKSLL